MAEIAPLPPDFARAMLELHGKEAQWWLERLPALLDECTRRWSLDLHPPFLPLTYNYVAPGVRASGEPVVLKVGVPNPELSAEMEALAFFRGRGAARLLAVDRDRGALLLERLLPGSPLAELDDEDTAMDAAAGVMAQLWRPAPARHSYPTVEKWAAGLERLRATFDGGTGPFAPRLVARAESLFTELIRSMGERQLLHGDLHHHNILSAVREPWLAIDPKGLVGERAYEVGALLRNPLPALLRHPDPGRVLARRVDRLAERLDLDRQRILGWGLAQAVLSGWWSYEDHGHGWEPALRCAEILKNTQ